MQITFQSSATDLGILNTLGLAVFLVGLALILLMAAHWYRMKDTVERKQKMHSKYGFTDGKDDISQLQHMSREELKAMVIREKEKKEHEDTEKSSENDAASPEPAPTATASSDSVVTEALKTTAETVNYDTPKLPGFEEPGTGESDNTPGPPKIPETLPKEALEAELLAKIVMPDEKEEKDESIPVKKELTEPKNPYIDKVERSPLSNEIPEEFKKKSRRI